MEQAVGETNGTNKDKKSNKEESKSEGFTAGGKYSAETPARKTTDVGIPQDRSIVSLSTSFGVNVCIDVTVTDHQVLWIDFHILKAP